MEFFRDKIPSSMEKMKVKGHIYKVPIEKISFTGTANGGFIQGGHKTYALVEANSEPEALIYLANLDSFTPNWNKLPEEKRTENPFRFREGKIEQELDCPIRYNSKKGWIFCGPPTIEDKFNPEADNGYFGGCCLDGSYNNENAFCPYYQEERLNEIKKEISKTNSEKETYLRELRGIDTSQNLQLERMKKSILSKL